MKQTELTITDYNLKDTVEHGSEEFPIQYYVDELYCYSKQMIPLHWHSDLFSLWRPNTNSNWKNYY